MISIETLKNFSMFLKCVAFFKAFNIDLVLISYVYVMRTRSRPLITILVLISEMVVLIYIILVFTSEILFLNLSPMDSMLGMCIVFGLLCGLIGQTFYVLCFNEIGLLFNTMLDTSRHLCKFIRKIKKQIYYYCVFKAD